MIISNQAYPRPWPGYTVPEFGGRLNGHRCTLLDPDILPTSYPESTFSIEQLSGVEEDMAALQRVVADAQATQSIHRELIQHMTDWEMREPGRLNSDDDLRNAFIANLEGLRGAFTDRTLQMVGVTFPMMLDRANPAHAVIVAVRDDIADTSARLQARKAQELVGKQVAEAKIGLPEMLARQAGQTMADVADALRTGTKAGGDALKDFASTLAWILGGGVVLYLVTQRGGAK